MVMPMENLMPKGDSLTGAELVNGINRQLQKRLMWPSKSYKYSVERSTATTPWVFCPTDGPSISSAMTSPIFCHRW